MLTGEQLRVRIEADIAEENRQATVRAIFAHRDATKRAIEAKQRPDWRKNAPGFAFETLKESGDPEGDSSDGFDWSHASEGDYRSVCANQTGRPIPEVAFETLRQRRDEMDAQTVEIAQALEARGGKFYYGPGSPNAVSVIGLFSGTVLPLPAVRRVAFLPSVAAQNRSKMLRDVEHFIACHPTQSRMFTVTSGPRIRLETPAQFRAEVMKFSRFLSKVNYDLCGKRGTLRRYGVSIQWRALEFGTPQFDGGKLTLHLHSHLLTKESRPLTGKQRARFRRAMWRRLGVHWSDDGRVENAREFVKYPVKPGDVQSILTQGGPGVLCDLFEAIRGLHITQPLGELRAVRAIRRANARRITAFNRPDGRSLEETGDWNAQKRPLIAPTAERLIAREKLKRAILWKTLVRLTRLKWAIFPGVRQHHEEITELDARDDYGNRATPSDSTRRTPRVSNRVIARLSPAPYGTPVCEPGVVVWGFDGNLDAVLAQPQVAAIREAHADAWQRAQDARALIRASAHADARTRAQRAASESSQRSNNCPGDLWRDAPPDVENRPPPVLAGVN